MRMELGDMRAREAAALATVKAHTDAAARAAEMAERTSSASLVPAGKGGQRRRRGRRSSIVVNVLGGVAGEQGRGHGQEHGGSTMRVPMAQVVQHRNEGGDDSDADADGSTDDEDVTHVNVRMD